MVFSKKALLTCLSAIMLVGTACSSTTSAGESAPATTEPEEVRDTLLPAPEAVTPEPDLRVYEISLEEIGFADGDQADLYRWPVVFPFSKNPVSIDAEDLDRAAQMIGEARYSPSEEEFPTEEELIDSDAFHFGEDTTYIKFFHEKPAMLDRSTVPEPYCVLYYFEKNVYVFYEDRYYKADPDSTENIGAMLNKMVEKYKELENQLLRDSVLTGEG